MPGEKPRVQPLHVPLLRSDPLPPLLGQARGQHRWEGALLGGQQRCRTPLAKSAVAARTGGAGECWHKALTVPMYLPPQVIYKKFQIPCPLPEQEWNLTGSLNATPVSTSDYQNGYTVLQTPEQGTCTPSFFTLNSQVGAQDAALGFWVCPHPVHPMKPGGPGADGTCQLGSWCSAAPLSHRQRTPSPSWPSPSSATQRSCPSTPS